jgi:hypothetical protein
MPQQDPIKPGQQTTIPSNNYDVNKDLGRVEDRLNVVNAPTAPNLLFNSGVPLTDGGNGKVNPFYAQYINILKNSPTNPLTQPYYTQLGKTERYSTNEYGGYHPFDANLENWYGENQGWFNQWGNRIGKFGIKTVGSFANALMDIPNAINAFNEGNLDKMWDNPVNTWASDMMEWSEKILPNYQRNWETEHPFLNLIPFYGKSANSWGKVIENLGFTVGAVGGAVVEDLGVGIVTGGVGEIPLAAMQINKVVYKLGKLINAGEDALGALRQTIKNSDDIVKGLRGIDRFNYTVRKGLWGANMITSGFGEAAFEGIESHKNLVKDLNQQFLEENGRLPSYEESQKIENTARDAANARFLMNSALLAITNSIQWGSLIKPFNVVKEVAEEEAKAGVRIALKEGSIDAFEAIAPKAKLARIGNTIKNNKLTKGIIGSSSEAFEEGAQFAIQKGVEDFYKRKYNSASIDFTNNFMKSFGTAMSETLGSREGWENMVYGLLGGAMFKGGQHIYYRSRGMQTPDYKKKVESTLEALNTATLTGIFENKYGEAVAAASIEEDMVKAAKEGNAFLYQNYKHEQFANFVLSGIQQNKFETRMEQLQELKKLDDEEFNKIFGIPATSSSRRVANDYVNTLEESARNIKEISDRVNRTFINPFTYRGTGNYRNKQLAEDIIKENEKYLVYEETKKQLIFTQSVSKNSSDRIKGIQDQIASTQDVLTPQEVITLSSAEGLKSLKKDYKERINGLKQSLETVKDDVTKRELDWYEKRLEDINSILDGTDKDAVNERYNKFLGEVFDRAQRDKGSYYEIYGSQEQKDSVKRPFPRDVITETINLGRDIALIQERNDVAIKNYAALTTKGGFKSLFDELLAIRERANEKVVKLISEEPQSQNDQIEAALQAGQSQPITPTQSPAQGVQQQGEVTETLTELSEDDLIRISRIVVDIVDGKYIASEDELEFVGGQTIDNLKFDNPNVDLKEYTKVKSATGKNYYIPNSVVNTARIKATQGVSDVAEFNKKGTPEGEDAGVAPPPSTPTGITSDDLLSHNFMAKVFVPNDLKQAFNDAVFSGTVDQVKAALSITVRPLSTEFQAQYDEQKRQGSYKPVEGLKGVFVSKAPIDISLSHNNVEIGKIAYPERLLFDNGKRQLVTINKITPKRYQELTGKPAANYALEVQEYVRQVAFKNYLALRYKNNNLNPTTIPANELNDLVDITVTYGEYDLVTRAEDRPHFSELKHNTVSIPKKDGGLIDTMVILSFPKRYNSDTMIRERSSFNEAIYGQNYYDDPNVDNTKIKDFVNSNVDNILKIGTRYIGLVELPNGVIRTIALRPGEMNETQKEELFNKLKDRALESAKANFVESDEENADGALLIGDKKIFYKLPSDKAREFNDDFNTEINNSLFISDVNGRVWFNLSVSPIGAIRLEIVDPLPTGNLYYTLYIAPQKVENITSLSALVEAFSKEIEKKNKVDGAFASLKIKLSVANFRQNIADDSSIPNAETLANLVTTSTSREVFKNGTMRMFPNLGNLQSVWKEEGGAKKAETAPEQQKQSPQPDNKTVESSVEQSQDQITDLFGPQQSFDDATKSGFAHLQSVSETGDPINQDDVFSAAKMEDEQSPGMKEATSLANQEDLTNIEFNSVSEALASVGIYYHTKEDGTLVYLNTETREIIDLPEITPVELVERLNLKIKKQPKGDPTEGFDFSIDRAETAEIQQISNIEKARRYIHSILPSYIKVEEIDNIINKVDKELLNGNYTVWGAYSKGIIYINSNTPSDRGTEYHEAFHAVFDLMLTPEQRKFYLDQIKAEVISNAKKTKTDPVGELRKNGYAKQSMDKIYEEFLANKFQEWKLNKSKGGIFSRLFDLIRRLFRFITRNKNELDALFRKIDAGKFKYTKLSSNEFTQ